MHLFKGDVPLLGRVAARTVILRATRPGGVAGPGGLCDALDVGNPTDPTPTDPTPTAADDEQWPIPWSARPPQRYVFATLAVVLGIAIVVTAVAYIQAGTGGIVPFLMITVGPVLAVVYVYYFGFRKFDQQD